MNSEENDTDLFAIRLKSARELRQLTQGDLGTKAGLPASSIAHFEAGNRKPSFANLRKLAIALDVTTDYLLGRTDDTGVGPEGHAAFRDFSNLTDTDKQLAESFLKMLAERNSSNTK
jgi:transcriptional regulator with XRE-family HTH domain